MDRYDLLFHIIMGISLVIFGYIIFNTLQHNSEREAVYLNLQERAVLLRIIDTESCKIQCKENNLSYSSTDSKKGECSCYEEDNLRISRFTLKIDAETAERYIEQSGVLYEQKFTR